MGASARAGGTHEYCCIHTMYSVSKGPTSRVESDVEASMKPVRPLPSDLRKLIIIKPLQK